MTDTEETRPNSLVAFGEMLLSWKMVIKIPTIISPATGVPALFTRAKSVGTVRHRQRLSPFDPPATSSRPVNLSNPQLREGNNGPGGVTQRHPCGITEWRSRNAQCGIRDHPHNRGGRKYIANGSNQYPPMVAIGTLRFGFSPHLRQRKHFPPMNDHSVTLRVL